MCRVEELRSDHAAIRRKTEAMRAALARAEAEGQLREEFRTFAALMSEHVQREAETFKPQAVDIQALRLAEAPHDYAEPQVVLRELEEVFAAWCATRAEPLTTQFSRLLDELQERLEEEERNVFPALRSVNADTPQA